MKQKHQSKPVYCRTFCQGFSQVQCFLFIDILYNYQMVLIMSYGHSSCSDLNHGLVPELRVTQGMEV